MISACVWMSLGVGLPERMQLKQWVFTDNACPAAGDAAAKLKQREEYASKELLLGERKLQQVLTLERNQIGAEVVKEEKELSAEAQRAVITLAQQGCCRFCCFLFLSECFSFSSLFALLHF